MNNNLKLLAVFTAGISCGVLATYSFFKKKYSDIADREIAAMENVMNERLNKAEKKENEDNKMPEKWDSSIVDMKKRATELTNYNNLTDDYISSVPPNENFIEERIGNMHDKMEKLAEAEHPEEETGEQYEITSMDWIDDAFYDKVILTYYVGDDTVANETGSIDDVDMSIGMEQFEKFKDSDDNERYIRNPALGIDYNIIKEMGCYHV